MSEITFEKRDSLEAAAADDTVDWRNISIALIIPASGPKREMACFRQLARFLAQSFWNLVPLWSRIEQPLVGISDS